MEKPSFRALVRECSEARVTGPVEDPRLILEVLDYLGVSGVCVDVEEYIPRHVGLGSTTQITLSTASAASYVKLGSRPDPVELALRLGRGKYSSVGTLLFIHGGYVVDPGAPMRAGIKPLARHRIPRWWRFIVIIPEARRGLSEEEEDRVMNPPIRPGGEQLLLMSLGALRLTSGIARGDLGESLRGLEMMQRGTGMYFSAHQGGTYREDVKPLVEALRERGVIVAQSSWGPTLYTIAGTRESGERVEVVRDSLRELGLRAEILESRPRNLGARIRAVAG